VLETSVKRYCMMLIEGVYKCLDCLSVRSSACNLRAGGGRRSRRIGLRDRGCGWRREVWTATASGIMGGEPLPKPMALTTRRRWIHGDISRSVKETKYSSWTARNIEGLNSSLGCLSIAPYRRTSGSHFLALQALGATLDRNEL
jgi:hypothetical protein